MESGRIEPLRALPVHREAPASRHPSGPNLSVVAVKVHNDSTFTRGLWPLAAANSRG